MLFIYVFMSSLKKETQSGFFSSGIAFQPINREWLYLRLLRHDCESRSFMGSSTHLITWSLYKKFECFDIVLEVSDLLLLEKECGTWTQV